MGLFSCSPELSSLPLKNRISVESLTPKGLTKKHSTIELLVKGAQGTEAKGQSGAKVTVRASGAVREWIYGLELQFALETTSGKKIRGFKRQTSRCLVRYLLGGKPTVIEYDVVPSSMEVAGTVGGDFSFRGLCLKKARRQGDNPKKGLWLPNKLQVLGDVTVQWRRDS
ncbi:MAG: hypothetical protein VYA34_10930 [Myxococcota bacterium]|nr:hypothetical protein [Myxococcota bacterium]